MREVSIDLHVRRDRFGKNPYNDRFASASVLCEIGDALLSILHSLTVRYVMELTCIVPLEGNPGNAGILPRTLDVLFNSIPPHLKAMKFVFKPDNVNGYDVRRIEDAMMDRQV